MPKITINGKEIDANAEMTVLDVTRREGIDIPTLCYHEALGPYGACRLCVVEAEGPMLRRSLQTSCTLRVSEGLKIETETPLVNTSRKLIFELLIAKSPEARPLRELAARYGVDSTRFHSDKTDECVKCGICVRVCQDKIGVSAISFAKRGQNRHVTGEFEELSESCIGCATCVNMCPTGAIKLKDSDTERTIWIGENTISRLELIACDACGKPFMTRKHFDYILSRLKDKPGIDTKLKTCPECTRQGYADKLIANLSIV
ncbi:MAG: 2Fe-2S iron-sulfur cluster-binding protein [Nitrospirae bacterium]|nr:2Fe-2S iron-sulfur cluster-binding protein [Nitrospirota bacterium]